MLFTPENILLVGSILETDEQDIVFGFSKGSDSMEHKLSPCMY